MINYLTHPQSKLLQLMLSEALWPALTELCL